MKQFISRIIDKVRNHAEIPNPPAEAVVQVSSTITENDLSVRQDGGMKFDYIRFPRKLNLGCGFDVRPGYLNVDFQEFHKPNLLADVRRLPMLPSGYYEEVVAQDCLEHFPRLDTQPALLEWSRLLKPKGVLELRVPNLIGLFELFVSHDFRSIEKQQTLVQCLFGTQAYEGDWHLTGFTKTLLIHYLQEAGFHKIEMKARDHWLLDVIAIKK